MYEVINNTNKEIPELPEVSNYIEYVIKELNLSNCIFDITFVTDEEIHKINKEYRNVDRATDVISFAFEEGEKNINKPFRTLGDIYISVDTAYNQAKVYQHSTLREICFLATHGILHLLGYDHLTEEEEKEMFDKQRELLDNYGIKR